VIVLIPVLEPRKLRHRLLHNQLNLVLGSSFAHEVRVVVAQVVVAVDDDLHRDPASSSAGGINEPQDPPSEAPTTEELADRPDPVHRGDHGGHEDHADGDHAGDEHQRGDPHPLVDGGHRRLEERLVCVSDGDVQGVRDRPARQNRLLEVGPELGNPGGW